MNRLVHLSQTFIAEVLSAGDQALDGTVGNGHDTAFLARHVGPEGRVYGFDVQQAALDGAKERLESGGLAARTCLFHAGHETMDAHLPEDCPGLRAAIFNLGYLPGGSHDVVTAAAATLEALNCTLGRLLPGGRLSVMIYTGHPGGAEEGEAVVDWASQLDPRGWQVVHIRLANQPPVAPQLLLVEQSVRPAHFE